jgi:lysyl-tRNA synthetase class 2
MKTLKYYLFREQLIKKIRQFFLSQGFHEFITPVLNDSIPLEPNIYPFETEWKTARGIKRFYLSTSPEKHLKKMLALGVNKCFSIGHSFRNLETSSPLHSPEFLMLEWYRKNADYKDIMIDVEKLLSHFNVLKHYKRFSLVELFKEYAKIDVVSFLNDAKNRADYDKLFVNEIESRLPKDPLFIIDYPSIISPLCKPKKANPLLAERFEFYWKGIELANGNTENTDYRSILKFFKAEQSSRKAHTSPITPIDHDFLNSLKKMQNASYAGVGFGVDRLIMMFQK